MLFTQMGKTASRALLLGGLCLTAVQAQAVVVDFQIKSSWADGYSSDVVITNNSAKPIDGWKLSLVIGHALKSVSRATVTGKDPYVFSPLSYSRVIDANGTQRIGVTGAAAFDASRLKNCVFNNVSCTVKVNGKVVSAPTTSTPRPTATKAPIATSTPRPTATKAPVATSTPRPTATKKPTATSTPKPTATPVVSASGIVHPGLLNSLSDLEAIKKHIANNEEPWTSEFKALKSFIAKRSLHIPADEKIFCGGFNKDENGKTIVECNYGAEDGITAYGHALIGYLANDPYYSEQSIRFIMGWADNFRGFDPEPREGAQGNNALLQAGWVAPWFANAAEILRYTYSGWKADHTKRTKNFLNLLLPMVSDETKGAPNNWLHSRIEAHIAIAIFFDDKAMLDKAFKQWKDNAPSYFYITSDGDYPPAPNRPFSVSSYKSAWWGATKFVQGMTQETCRDLNHQQLGTRSIFNGLAMAQVQGVDLLAGTNMRYRLSQFLETQAKWMEDKRAPSGICPKPIVVYPPTNTGMEGAEPVNYQMAYKLLYTSTNTLPRTKAAIEASDPIRALRWVQKWETLTHYR